MLLRGEKDYLKHFCNQSELVRLVPPLRGFPVRGNVVPPLPRWAMFCRPWRDFAVRQCALRRDRAVMECARVGTAR
jgi:hypothetical protein